MGRLIAPKLQTSPQSPQETGVLGQLGQGALDVGAAILGVPGSIAGGIANLVSTPEQRQMTQKAFGEGGSPLGNITGAVQGARNLTGYTEPQTTAQRLAYNAGAFLPEVAKAAATGGGSLVGLGAQEALKAAGKAAIKPSAVGLGSAAGRTLAQELDLGTVGEIASSILGGVLGGNIARGGTKNVVNKIIPVQKEAYKAAKLLGEDRAIHGNDIFNSLRELNNTASTSLSGPAYNKYLKQFQHDIKMIGKSIDKDGFIPVNKLTELKKQFNDIIYDKDTPIRAKTIYNEAKDLLLAKISAVEKVFPEWGKEFRKGENLTTFIKGSERFKDFFRKHPNTKELFKDLSPEVTHLIKNIGSPDSIPKTLFKIGTAPVYYSGKYLANQVQDARELLTNPATSELLQELYKGVAEDNVGNVVRSLIGLSNVKESNSNQQSPQQIPLGRGRIIPPKG